MIPTTKVSELRIWELLCPNGIALKSKQEALNAGAKYIFEVQKFGVFYYGMYTIESFDVLHSANLKLILKTFGTGI